MLRALTFVLAFSLFTSAAAAADDGLHKARFSIDMTLAQAFFDRLEAQGEDLGPFGGEVLLEPVGGCLHFSAAQMRLDLAYGPEHNATSVADLATNTLLLFDHENTLVYRTPLGDYTALFDSAGLPVISPEQFLLHWQGVRRTLEGKPGMRSTALGRKEVAGLNCQGVTYSCPLRSLTPADGIQIVPDLPALRRLDSEWKGTFWVSERHDLPVKMVMEFCGITLSLQITGFDSGLGGPVLFAVPPGYDVEDTEAASVF